MAGSLPMLLGATIPAVGSARNAARMTQDMNKLKQMLVALHMYQATHGVFPAAKRTIEKGDGLSWRVELLPYLDQQALYDEFHHDEPWNSEHNLSLIKKMPPFFQSTSQGGHAVAVSDAVKEAPKKEGEIDERAYGAFRTPFLTIQHEDSVFPPNAEKGTKFRDIIDGTSNTIAVVMAKPEAAVIWTKPDDLHFNPEKPLVGLSHPGGVFLAGFCDGHVSRVQGAISEEVLKAMVTKSGGEVVRAH